MKTKDQILLEKIYLNILNEEQVFNFNRFEGTIKKFVEFIKKNPNATIPPNLLFFYQLITNTGTGVGSANNLGYSDDEIKKWKDYFHSLPWNSNGVWSQLDFNPNLKLKKDNTSYNFYVTIKKTKQNINKFWISLRDLSNKIKSLSDTNQVALSFKTHTILDSMVTHNDSIKFYFYDQSISNDVHNVVNAWLNENGIEISERTHTFGIDKSGNSYGQMLANTLTQYFSKIIIDHPQASTDELVDYIKTNTPEVIKRIKTQSND